MNKAVTLFALVFVGVVFADTVVAQQRDLNNAEITELLTGRSVQGVYNGREWTSRFSASGETIYTENAGRPTAPSVGRWRVTDNQYCSQWPPSDAWDCYKVTAEADKVTFVPLDGGDPWPGVLVKATEAKAGTGTITTQEAESEPTRFISQDLQLGAHTVKARLPAGFTLELLTHRMEVPRVLHFHGSRLLVGSRSGNIYYLDPPYTQPRVLTRLEDYPHSVVVQNDKLYVAQTHGISVASYTANTESIDPASFSQLVALPGGRGHNSRTLKAGPDNRLYVSLGIAGNCSDQYLNLSYPEDQRRGGFFVVDLNANPATLIPFASGLRNPVGFDWHPDTSVLYASNNGPDHSGYDLPPEYFAEVTAGSFHGMPWFQFDGEKLVRDKCVESEPPLPVSEVVKPVATFPARIAPMDMVFVTGDANASQFKNDALVALHGSWATSNGGGDGEPSTRRAPKLVRVVFEDGKVTGVEDFLTGFQLANGARWARPMGIAIGPDGDIYFSSDDGVNGLYRLRYSAD